MNKLNVVIVPVGKEPYAAEIEDKLDSYQSIVHGFIEPVYFEEGLILICNDEGKINGLKGNRRVGDDIIAGDFFIVADGNDGEFHSLTPEQIETIIKRFKQTEAFTAEDVENAIIIEVRAF